MPFAHSLAQAALREAHPATVAPALTRGIRRGRARVPGFVLAAIAVPDASVIVAGEGTPFSVVEDTDL